MPIAAPRAALPASRALATRRVNLPPGAVPTAGAGERGDGQRQGAAPGVPTPKASIRARGELTQLKHWLTVTGAKIGAGAAFLSAVPFAFGHPVGWLMAAGLLGATALGGALGAFAGSQLGDLGEYESGRIALERGGPPH